MYKVPVMAALHLAVSTMVQSANLQLALKRGKILLSSLEGRCCICEINIVVECSGLVLSESTVKVIVSNFQKLQVWLSVTILSALWPAACDHSEEPLMSSILKVSLWPLKSSQACAVPPKGVS